MRRHRKRTSSEAKRAVMKRCGTRCEDCKAKLVTGYFHVHHETYVRFGNELPEDLLVLCLNCHEKRHPHHNFKPHTVRGQRKGKQSRRARNKELVRRFNEDETQLNSDQWLKAVTRLGCVSKFKGRRCQDIAPKTC